MDLIERLEAASEGSRELDRAIMEAVYLPTLKQWNGIDVESWWADGDGYGCNTVDGRRHEKVICLSQWTRSIDAALSLVPEGASASATKHGNGKGAAEIWAYVSQKFALHGIKMEVGGEMKTKFGRLKWRKGQFLVFRDRKPIGTMTYREFCCAKTAACNLPKGTVHHQNIGAATPALALCIAALRARQSQEAR